MCRWVGTPLAVDKWVSEPSRALVIVKRQGQTKAGTRSHYPNSSLWFGKVVTLNNVWTRSYPIKRYPAKGSIVGLWGGGLATLLVPAVRHRLQLVNTCTTASSVSKSLLEAWSYLFRASLPCRRALGAALIHTTYTQHLLCASPSTPPVPPSLSTACRASWTLSRHASSCDNVMRCFRFRTHIALR